MFQRRGFSQAFLSGVLLVSLSCGGGESNGTGAEPLTPVCDVVVDRFKELIVVEPSVVEDARARNETAGPWSFRHIVEEMTPPGTTTSDFVSNWLSLFTQQATINMFSVPARPRLNEILLCPWLRQTPENQCDAACGSCAARTLDMAKAPFRLIGLANRIDLRLGEEPAGVGETRLIYAVTRGPGDDPASEPTRMTTIFEFQNPNDQGRDAIYWGRRWHALGAHKAYDEAFMADLESLYTEVTARPADVTRPSWLNQMRTNEITLDWLWDMREFKLAEGALRLTSTARTPDKSLNGSPELARFVLDNQNDIMSSRHTVPSSFEAGFARPSGRWLLPGVGETLRHAFARETCDGCHQLEETPSDQNFHVSPMRRGIERLSPFLHDPLNPEGDELSHREQLMKDLLCGQTGLAPYGAGSSR
jgi:hypothetical protein